MNRPAAGPAVHHPLTRSKARGYDGRNEYKRRPRRAISTTGMAMRYALSLLRPAVWLANWVNGTENLAAGGVAMGLYPQDYRMVQDPMVR